jgi:hypothetical protein
MFFAMAMTTPFSKPASFGLQTQSITQHEQVRVKKIFHTSPKKT